jgi:ribonuclease E
MVERPIEEEPSIAETAAPAEAEPAAPKRGRQRKAAAKVEDIDVSRPEEVAAKEAPAPATPARKRRSKKADAAPAVESAPGAEPIPVPAANNDTADEGSGEPRRGWWQKTFG